MTLRRPAGRWPAFLILAIPMALCAQPAFAAEAALADGTTPAEETAPAAATDEAEASGLDGLPKKYRAWLERVETLISEEERAYFLGLSEDFRRDAFIQAFWKERDPWKDTGHNELRFDWEERVDQALARWGTLDDERAQYYVRHGEPFLRCLHARKEIEVWTFYEGPDPMPAVNADQYYYPALFYARFPGEPYRRWRGFGFFHAAARRHLPDVPALDFCDEASVARGMRTTPEAREPDTMESLDTPEPSKEWVAAFAAATTDLPAGAETVGAELAFEFPGRHQQRTVAQGIVLLDRSRLTPYEGASGERIYQLLMIGEVVRDGALFESFRYRFEVPDEPAAGARLPLVFQRYLRPGPARVILKLEDLHGRRFVRLDHRLEVPAAEGPAPPGLGLPRHEDSEIFRLLATADEATRRGERALELLPPPGVVHAGMVRFAAMTVGDIERVDFLLDGQTILSKRRPPFSVELYLGELPEAHRLRAEGYDAAGELAASDELILNPGGQRFRVHITEPLAGGAYRDSVRAAVQVVAPDGGEVERVELFLDEERVATLYQPPYVQPLLLDGAPLAHLRAVAYLADGNASEDSVFINTPGEIDEIYVHFVELYATVYDRRGRPVLGLTRDSFRVLEDGERQRAKRFEWVEDLPLHAALLIDTSASMEERLTGVGEAALTFLREVVTPRDRATLIPFNHQPRVAVRFTNDVDELSRELRALRAGGSTSIYDSLIFALQYFQGIRGQKALLLLSDGEDESSHFDVDAALEAARRAGVTIYTIWLQEAKLERTARRTLTRLAEETGGRAYFSVALADLAGVYAAIQQELRSQYLFGYQSTSTKGPDEFRRVEVKVEVDGRPAEVRAMSGYYP